MLRQGALLATLVAAAQAIDGITIASIVSADTATTVSFQGSSTDQYRVYLAASITGTQGPTCYLTNSTALTSPLTLTIPASVGPSANYYSIGLRALNSAPPTTAYSNTFALTNATGIPTQYELHLAGAPFWDPDALPCAQYSCARSCAAAGYPADMSSPPAYAALQRCVLACPGVAPDDAAAASSPPQSSPTSAADGDAAGDAALSLASAGVVVGGSTTVAFGGVVTAASSATGTGATIQGAAARGGEAGLVAAAAGLAVLLL